MDKALQTAYNYCQQLAIEHYENFPVASKLLPKPIRLDVCALYAFARIADDIADEGSATASHRMSQLENLEQALLQFTHRNMQLSDPMLIALQHTVKRHQLPIELLLDLLKAFKQDVSKSSYENFREVFDYCQCSANPIGRLLLHLTNNDKAENLFLSDKICTALQLINFLQDIVSDLTVRNRCYLPKDEMTHYGINLDTIAKQQYSTGFQQLIQLQLSRIYDLYQTGKGLCQHLSGRFGLEVRLMILGGERVLQKLMQRDNPFTKPTLTKFDKVTILFKALLMPRNYFSSPLLLTEEP